MCQALYEVVTVWRTRGAIDTVGGVQSNRGDPLSYLLNWSTSQQLSVKATRSHFDYTTIVVLLVFRGSQWSFGGVFIWKMECSTVVIQSY